VLQKKKKKKKKNKAQKAQPRCLFDLLIDFALQLRNSFSPQRISFLCGFETAEIIWSELRPCLHYTFRGSEHIYGACDLQKSRIASIALRYSLGKINRVPMSHIDNNKFVYQSNQHTCKVLKSLQFACKHTYQVMLLTIAGH
jgi:hypothetical protein